MGPKSLNAKEPNPPSLSVLVALLVPVLVLVPSTILGPGALLISGSAAAAVGRGGDCE